MRLLDPPLFAFDSTCPVNRKNRKGQARAFEACSAEQFAAFTWVGQSISLVNPAEWQSFLYSDFVLSRGVWQAFECN